MNPKAIENQERAVQYAEKRFGIKTLEELRYQLSLISLKSKTVFIARWGIDGTSFCQNFQQLGQKMKISNPEELYKKAEQELLMLVIFVQAEQLPGDIAEGLSKLVNHIFSEQEKREQVNRVDAKELIWTINTKLSPIERNIIYQKFGLVCGNCTSTQDLVKQLNLQSQHIYQIQAMALRKLENNKNNFLVNP